MHARNRPNTNKLQENHITGNGRHRCSKKCQQEYKDNLAKYKSTDQWRGWPGDPGILTPPPGPPYLIKRGFLRNVKFDEIIIRLMRGGGVIK